MALLSFEQENERAADKPPFANGFEGQSWMGIWCEECRHLLDCPLLQVALLGRTPQQWHDREPMSLNRYTCLEFEKSEDDQ